MFLYYVAHESWLLAQLLGKTQTCFLLSLGSLVFGKVWQTCQTVSYSMTLGSQRKV